ncbi:hypothetical protein ZWY2020_027971 [Hordeum vulgare]|nr:hypothetical protein ZWY2020_027971 [Hordeum vulgare]
MEFSPRAAELMTLLGSRMTNFYTDFQVDEIGRVVSVGDGMSCVYGLNGIQAGEMVEFASSNVGIVVFGSDTAIKEGDLVKCNGSLYLLGVPIDGKGVLSDHERRHIKLNAPGIIERKSMHEPMQKGLKAVDSMVPIGRAINTILNQKKMNSRGPNGSETLYCVYVAIGQKCSTLAQLVQILSKANVLEYSILVAATASYPAPLQFMAHIKCVPWGNISVIMEYMH